MSFKQITYLIIFISIIHPTFGQGGSLTIENTLAIVKKYHPVIKQSILQNKIAQNEITVAKSIFDPTIQINTEEKSFDNKFYYKINNSELKIPLWYGIDVKAGLENNIGDRLDPSLTNNKSSFVGISIDPFRGILLDKRKAIILQAKGFLDLTKNEQNIVVNDLLFEASNAYWNWVNSYYNFQILQKTVLNNKERFEVIKKSFLSGDRAAIDTTESLTQLQTFEILETQAALELQKAKNELSNFFWTENGLPYELNLSIQPDNLFEIQKINLIDIENLESLIQKGTNNHPKIKLADSKLNILDIEKRIKTIELFPTLKMNYNTLDYNYTTKNLINNFNVSNNFKYGITLSMPLFQRNARGEIAKTKNKIEEQNWNKKYISLEIENKIKNSFTEFYSLKEQVKTNENILVANKLLFDTENTKFKLGESSLFLINNRELKYIESEQKHISLKSKLYLSMYKNLWAIGGLL